MASSPAGMARASPVNLLRSPDQSHLRCSEETNKTHHGSPSNSSYNSTNSRNTEAMNIAISERELDGIQKINSPGHDRMIHRELFYGNDSTNQGLQHTQKSHDSIKPIARTDEIRPTSHHFHGVLTTGDYSPGEEVHLPSC
ncbi:hypothetical protein H5410_050950 [Solanum commersonii]|uniref:Uncharacterized protein n=1 Tax=Solanum commersonii TaxID=4109 RepID=A0A9J5WWZ8_SOLCO|nr:hypothetical protein H5410_050950 [Solanum commersonii]